MAEKIIIILCEGPHDVAFLSKILKSDGFKSFESLNLSEYPSPMNSLMIQEVSKSNFNELNLHTVRQSLLPSGILKKDTNNMFLYSLGGDSKKVTRQSIVTELVSFLPKEGKIEIMPKDTTISLVYFFDADQKGTSSRLSEIHAELKEIIEIESFNEEKVINYRNLKIGGYVFADDLDLGKLEDILLPLMKLKNEKIFEMAEKYYNSLLDEKRGKKKNRDIKKSIIGIAGQLQNSGATNTVTIRHSDYISDDKIRANNKCQAIIKFFRNFID